MQKTYHADPPLYLGQNIYIKPNYIVSIPEFEKRRKNFSQKQLQNQANLKENKSNGILSKKSVQKMRNAINWLVASAKPKRVFDRKSNKNFYFKVNFITLTIPAQPSGMIDNKDFKEILHSWLVYASKYFGLKNYVWKVEAHKDFRLHIHITSDTFLHYKKLRISWNNQLKRKGYLDNYFSVKGHYDANSTDIHSVKSIKNMAGYMCEYMTKKTGLPESYNGRIWGCNQALSSANTCHVHLSRDELSDNMNCLFSNVIEFKDINSKPDVFGGVRKLGEIFFLESAHWASIIKGKIKQCYDDHRFYIRHNIFKPPPEYFSIN